MSKGADPIISTFRGKPRGFVIIEVTKFTSTWSSILKVVFSFPFS